jgi:UDP-N-acetylglucosamine 1-carboxyvinyltransferase
MVTVTGTENFMMAASAGRGRDHPGERGEEPEITDLAEMLIAMGAKVEGHGTGRIRIQGVERCTAHAPRGGRPHRGRHLPVRGGRHRRRRGAAHGRADHLDAVIDKLREAGAEVTAVEGGIRVRRRAG